MQSGEGQAQKQRHIHVLERRDELALLLKLVIDDLRGYQNHHRTNPMRMHRGILVLDDRLKLLEELASA